MQYMLLICVNGQTDLDRPELTADEEPGDIEAWLKMTADRGARLLAQLTPDAESCLTHPLPAGLKVAHHKDDGLRWDEADRQRRPLTFTTPADLAPWDQAVLASRHW